MKRILNIVPVPVPAEALDAFAGQIPPGVMHPDFVNDFVAARAGARVIDSPYEQTLADAFVLDAGARAQDDGYDAVCVNSMSDSALPALRSRLDIPVMAPAIGSMLLACMLGSRFSVVTMWPRWHGLYTKAAAQQGITGRMASVRDIGTRPDAAELLAGKEESVFPLLERECRAAIDGDGADVIILGSTTMHQSHAYLSSVLEVPVINPGVVAIKLTELLVQCGLTHSRRAYAAPEDPQDDLFAPIG
ncbi:aspartate/glutamate racemase family protein [Microbacterium rhizophilus]|uniref:aspartate/glutamate racemase family protein n=1 Tax=Microbacterium rhizophilus TaxID=3138934 RepID=UPI0031E8C5D9